MKPINANPFNYVEPKPNNVTFTEVKLQLFDYAAIKNIDNFRAKLMSAVAFYDYCGGPSDWNNINTHIRYVEKCTNWLIERVKNDIDEGEIDDDSELRDYIADYESNKIPNLFDRISEFWDSF